MRERNRRRLGIGAAASARSWSPILWVVALTVVGTIMGHPYFGALAGIAVTVVRQLRPRS